MSDTPPKDRDRKLIMSWFILLAATGTMWFTTKLDGPTWVSVCVLCLAVYGAANVTEKRNK